MYMQKELQDVLLSEIKQIVRKHTIAHVVHICTIQQKILYQRHKMFTCVFSSIFKLGLVAYFE